MTRLAAGHDAALNDLMERHGPKLFHYLIRCLQNEEDAADLAQETFVRVWHRRSQFAASRAVKPWILGIAVNLARNRLRWWRHRPTVSLGEWTEVPERVTGPADSGSRQPNLTQV